MVENMNPIELSFLNCEHDFVHSDGKWWMLAEPVVKFLGFGSNVSRALSRYCRSHHYKAIQIEKAEGRQPLFVSLAGVTRLVIKSKKPEAESFQDWVTDDIVPTVLTKGGYISPTATNEQLEALQQEIAQLQQQNNQLTSQLFRNRLWSSKASMNGWTDLFNAMEAAYHLQIPYDVRVEVMELVSMKKGDVSFCILINLPDFEDVIFPWVLEQMQRLLEGYKDTLPSNNSSNLQLLRDRY